MDLICNHNDCTGCQACRISCPVSAIEMQENDRGFVYPVINSDKCIDCKKCQRVCPSLNDKNLFKEPQRVLAGWIKDKVNRHISTSGGVAHALSEWMIKKGGFVCGCRWVLDHAEHEIVGTIDCIKQFQGSKYSHSDVKDCYLRIKILLEEGNEVLFFGTGCQVAGLYSFLQKDYDKLLTADILCHGVPSQKALKERIEQIEKDNNRRVVNLRFRDKREDQHHTYYQYTFDDGLIYYCNEYQDYFSRGFDTNYLLRPNCFNCIYAQPKRIADITLADFWGYYPKKLSFMSFREGVSLILANSNKGLTVINCLNTLKKEDRSYDYAKKWNPNLNRPQLQPKDYELFWQEYASGTPLYKLAELYFPNKPIPPVYKNNWRTYKNVFLSDGVNKVLGRIKRMLHK